MSSKHVIALDIGATKVACAVAKHGEILGTGVVAYPARSASWPGDSQLIGRTIERALEATGVPGAEGRVTVALSHPELTHARVAASIELSDEPVPVRALDLARLRRHALSQALGIDREALLLEPLGFCGNGFEGVRDPRTFPTTRLHGTFAVVSLPLALRQLLMQATESAGLDLDRLVYSGQALAVACDDPEATGRGMGESDRLLLVDIGGCSTECVLLEGGYLRRSLTVPWGGMKAAEAIALRCRTTLDQALTLSLQGSFGSKPEVAQVWQEQRQALAEGMQQVLEGEPLPSRALVTGRGALVDGMVEWVQETTGMTAVLGRSPRSKSFSDIGQQLALGAVLGLLEMTEHPVPRALPRPSSLVDRLLVGTKTLLTEYF